MKGESIKVLIVDDDEDDFFIAKMLFEEIAAHTISVTWASSFQTGIDSYIKDEHDIYFVDYLLGAKTGIDFLIEISPMNFKKPVIMITGQGDRNVDKQAMAYGAADYLIKTELNADKLERSMRYALERFQAGIQLSESETKYRSIFEKSRDMIFITDSAGILIDCNESVVKLLGYSKKELQQTFFIDLFFDDILKSFFQKIILEKIEVVDFECIMLTLNRINKVCLISTIILQNNKNTAGIQIVVHDITKRRKAEKDLATAEKLAVTGRVVRMIGHEVRNPLTNINLSLEQIESETKNQENLVLYFDIIRRNSERINALITELLNSSNPAKLTFSKKSINKVAQDAIVLIQDRIVLKGVDLKTNYSSDICDITIDAEKVKMALVNILVNAIESMDDGHGKLEVTTKGDGDYCVIEIHDNGSGIPSQDLDRIFDPFFSGKPKGTGLGLSTTHNIILSHNGTIDVQSEIGKGTCFTIKFNFN